MVVTDGKVGIFYFVRVNQSLQKEAPSCSVFSIFS